MTRSIPIHRATVQATTDPRPARRPLPRSHALLGVAAALALLACQAPAARAVLPAPTAVSIASVSTPVAPPLGASIAVTAPAPGSRVPAGDLKVAFEVANIALVPAAQARKPDDFHVHVLLDVDPAPYIGTTASIPTGNPNVIHTAAKEVTFKDVQPGEHRIALIMTSPDHVSVRAPITAATTFVVE